MFRIVIYVSCRFYSKWKHQQVQRDSSPSTNASSNHIVLQFINILEARTLITYQVIFWGVGGILYRVQPGFIFLYIAYVIFDSLLYKGNYWALGLSGETKLPKGESEVGTPNLTVKASCRFVIYFICRRDVVWHLVVRRDARIWDWVASWLVIWVRLPCTRGSE